MPCFKIAAILLVKNIFVACAYKFVEAGSKVILSARNVSKLNEIKDEIVKQFGKVSTHI